MPYRQFRKKNLIWNIRGRPHGDVLFSLSKIAQTNQRASFLPKIYIIYTFYTFNVYEFSSLETRINTGFFEFEKREKVTLKREKVTLKKRKSYSEHSEEDKNVKEKIAFSCF